MYVLQGCLIQEIREIVQDTREDQLVRLLHLITLSLADIHSDPYSSTNSVRK